MRWVALLALLGCAQGEVEGPDGGEEDALVYGGGGGAGFDAGLPPPVQVPSPDLGPPDPDMAGQPPPPPPPPPAGDGPGPEPVRDAAVPDVTNFEAFDARPPPMEDPGCPGWVFRPQQPIAIQPFDVAFVADVQYAQAQLGLSGDVQANPTIADGRLVGDGAPYEYTWTIQNLPRGNYVFTFSAALYQGGALQQLGRCEKTVL